MKILISVLLLLTGIFIGYYIGVSKTLPTTLSKEFTTSSPIKTIHDTIIKKEFITIVKNKVIAAVIDTTKIDLLTKDTLIIDTLTEQLVQSPNDSIIKNEEIILISKDKKLKTIQLPLKHIINSEIKTDSTLKSSLNIIDKNNKTIVVEFWESPINFKGYKLSKAKLIVYGLSPQIEYQMTKIENEYYLKFHTMTYLLTETEVFTTFTEY